MFAAVTSRPSMATPGRPMPTGAVSEMPDAFTSRRTSRAIDALTRSGVDGCGVRTRSRSERKRPDSTSTTAALIPLPPTSTPMAILEPTVPRILSEVVDGDAAVDDERGAIRPARLIGREVDGHVDDLLRLPEATGRVAR